MANSRRGPLAEAQRPLATVVIGGLISRRHVTLLVRRLPMALFRQRDAARGVNETGHVRWPDFGRVKQVEVGNLIIAAGRVSIVVESQEAEAAA